MTDPDMAQRLAAVVADLEIRRLMYQYAATVDARDWAGLRAVFADDVTVEYHNGRTTVTGADKVVAYVRDNTAHLAWQHHLVSPYLVEIAADGQTAQCLTYLTSHQVIAADPSHVLMMAARYRTGLARGADGWCLTHMVHTITLTNFLPITATAPPGVDIPPPVAP